MTKNFPEVNPKQSFPEIEEKVLKFWKENDTFQKSIDTRPEEKPYRFYDGPPFITGMPHYGSLLSSICKDVVPRYHTMKGKRVERVWGWDCHGLPIEEKVQKKLGLESSKDIERIGIKKFIDECYTYTKETSSEWDWYIDHIGRWVDTKNAYRTMDQDYMESVMWVFKQMWDKDMVYKGQRVSLFSRKLSTPISNFEVAMDDSYETVSDPAITVMFPLLEERGAAKKGDFLLAWTTTPWTIPAHMSIALNPKVEYCRVSSEGNTYILAESRTEVVFKGKEFEVLESFLGEELLGLSYKAPFDFYQGTVDASKNHIILDADFITDTDGTGIGHQAPEFGDVDFQLAQAKGVHISNALDNAGKYTEEISDYVGMHYRDANDVVSEKLKELGLLFKKESINHRVAMCPRSGTPLIYKAQDSWFVNIKDMKSRLIEENEGINWSPNHLKHGQFQKSVESAPDWCISRTRYWGTPMPIWKDSQNNLQILGSKKEIFEANKPYGQLEEKDGTYIFSSGEFAGQELNLHRPYIDGVLAVNKDNFKPKKVLGIHGWTSAGIDKGYQGKWLPIKDVLANDGIQFDVPSFDKEKSTSYKKWKETLETIDIEEYDTVIATSFGCPVIMQYLSEKKASLERLILVAPSGLVGNEYLEKVIPEMTEDTTQLSNSVKEIIIIHSKDDDSTSASFGYGKSLAEKLDAIFIPVNGYKHSFSNWGANLLAGIIQYGEPAQRIPEVLDVWMDSGSMPYAQMHYPFQNKQSMEASYPADFIVEYIGQVRAWFYVMHVVGVALFDKRSFTNVITTGIVNGTDGRKMSKSYGNYPDPKATIKKYGADAIRFYMMNSPLMSGGNMSFSEEGVHEVVKKVILPLWNTYYFFTTYANIDNFQPQENSDLKSFSRSNPLDQWIVSELTTLVKDVETGFEEYRLAEAARPIVSFMDNLTNWYIRRSRKRFWKSESDTDKQEAYETLYHVLTTLCKVASPFMPFVTEHIYQNMTGKESIHLEYFPEVDESLINTELNADMAKTQQIINLGLAWRVNQKLRVRQPLSSITIGEELSDYYKDIIKEELNVKNVLVVEPTHLAKKICKPNGRLIGPKFGKNVKFIITEAKAGNFIELEEGRVGVGDFVLEGEEFEMAYEAGDSDYLIEAGFGMVIALDPTLTPELEQEGIARDLVRFIQEARKEAEYNVEDRIQVSLSGNIDSVLKNFSSYIENETLSSIVEVLSDFDLEKEIEVGDEKIILQLIK